MKQKLTNFLKYNKVAYIIYYAVMSFCIGILKEMGIEGRAHMKRMFSKEKVVKRTIEELGILLNN